MHRPHLTREQPLTIGLPVYNGEPFLSDALESLLGQTYGDFTLVVSDNASTDRTVEIVQQFAEDDNRIVLVRNKAELGAAWNLNHVFEYCRSPYFKWAAADDLLAPTCLERLIEVLASSPPSVVAAYPITQLIDVDGEAIRTYHRQPRCPAGSTTAPKTQTGSSQPRSRQRPLRDVQGGLAPTDATPRKLSFRRLRPTR